MDSKTGIKCLSCHKKTMKVTKESKSKRHSRQNRGAVMTCQSCGHREVFGK